MLDYSGSILAYSLFRDLPFGFTDFTPRTSTSTDNPFHRGSLVWACPPKHSTLPSATSMTAITYSRRISTHPLSSDHDLEEFQFSIVHS